jgi:hypothetical protein
VWERLQRADALDYGLCHPSRSLRTVFCDVVADSFKIIRGVRRPADAQSAPIALIHASRDFIVVEHPAFAGGSATLFDLAAEPLVMVH